MYDTDEPMTPFGSITTYNNYYEFGLDKDEPARNAHTLQTRPWTISVEGEVANPQVIDIDTLLQWFTLEQRIYRMRCVEAWSMVIPWVGFPLAELLKQVEPTSKAKYVAFESYYDTKQMPLGRQAGIQLPYVEGLRPFLSPEHAAGLLAIINGHPNLRRPTVLTVADPVEAEKHYAVHKGKPFYESLLSFLTSGPTVAIVWEGREAVAVVREMMGKTDGAKSAPGTIRGDYGISVQNNLIHGSDSPENAALETALWFSASELVNFAPADAGWIG